MFKKQKTTRQRFPKHWKIRYQLLEKGYTVPELAQEIGVSRQLVAQTIREPWKSARVRKAIIEKIGRDPWPGEWR